MKDTMFGLYNKCPSCGKKRGLYYSIQCPLVVTKRIDGKTFIKRDGKRITKISNCIKALIFDISQVDFQVAYCRCDLCNWRSGPIGRRG